MLRFGAICAAAVQDPLLVLPGRSESGLKASDEITDCFHVFGKRCLKTRSAERNMNEEIARFNFCSRTRIHDRTSFEGCGRLRGFNFSDRAPNLASPGKLRLPQVVHEQNEVSILATRGYYGLM